MAIARLAELDFRRSERGSRRIPLVIAASNPALYSVRQYCTIWAHQQFFQRRSNNEDFRL